MVRQVKMPSSAEMDKRYKDGATKAPANYKTGIEAASGVIDAAIAGQGLYEQRMSDPAVLKRRSDKLKMVTDEDWKKGAREKGVQRIGQGMIAAAPKRQKNYEGVRAALDGMTLADKTADPYANIDNNVKAVVKKMRQAAGKE